MSYGPFLERKYNLVDVGVAQVDRVRVSLFFMSALLDGHKTTSYYGSGL